MVASSFMPMKSSLMMVALPSTMSQLEPITPSCAMRENSNEERKSSSCTARSGVSQVLATTHWRSPLTMLSKSVTFL